MALLTNGVTIVSNLKQNENDIRNSAAHILLRLATLLVVIFITCAIYAEPNSEPNRGLSATWHPWSLFDIVPKNTYVYLCKQFKSVYTGPG